MLCSPPSEATSETTTIAPSAAKATLDVLPLPDATPVTRATFSAMATSWTVVNMAYPPRSAIEYRGDLSPGMVGTPLR